MNFNGSVKKGRKYQNTVPTTSAGFDKMLPIFKEYRENTAENIPLKQLGPFKTDVSIYQTPPKSGLRITWVGHSSLLIEIDGKRILTDPVWSERTSFVSFMGPKRFFDPPLDLNELPPLDAVIISHDHYDHLDKDTIRFFADKQIPFYCPLGVGHYLNNWGINLVNEMNWGNGMMMLKNNCVITATPARHFSGRGIFNRNETLWASFVIKGSKHTVFFGGDSGYFPGFADIGNIHGPFDLTMLEIGAYGKYWPDIHMGPDNAVNAHLALKGKLMMPIHWGTFNLAPHAWYEPIERLQELGKEKNIELFIPEPGMPTDVLGAYNSGWWERYR